MSDLIHTLARCRGLKQVSAALARMGWSAEPVESSVLAQSVHIDNAALSQLSSEGMEWANRRVKHLLESAGDGPLRRFLAVDRFCQLYLVHDEQLEYRQAMAQVVPTVNALESMASRAFDKTFVSQYEALKQGTRVDWTRLERVVIDDVLRLWRHDTEQPAGPVTLPMLADFYRDSRGQVFVDVDEAYGAKRYRTLLHDINNERTDESAWDFGLRLLRSLSAGKQEVRDRLRNVLYGRLHGGLKRFLRGLEEEADQGRRYFLEHNSAPPVPSEGPVSGDPVREQIRRQKLHKVRLLSREGFHSVSARFEHPAFVLLATDLSGRGPTAGSYLLLLPRVQADKVPRLEDILMSGRFDDYESEFVQVQAAVMREELRLETVRRRRSKLRANLAGCVGYAMGVAVCGAISGGIVGGLVTGSTLLSAQALGLLSGVIAFGALRHRISRSVQVTEISADTYDGAERLPRLLLIPRSGEARERHCAGLVSRYGSAPSRTPTAARPGPAPATRPGHPVPA